MPPNYPMQEIMIISWYYQHPTLSSVCNLYWISMWKMWMKMQNNPSTTPPANNSSWPSSTSERVAATPSWIFKFLHQYQHCHELSDFHFQSQCLELWSPLILLASKYALNKIFTCVVSNAWLSFVCLVQSALVGICPCTE